LGRVVSAIIVCDITAQTAYLTINCRFSSLSGLAKGPLGDTFQEQARGVEEIMNKSCGVLTWCSGHVTGLFDGAWGSLATVDAGDASQPFADILIGTMFVVFLMIFVLIGIYPAVKKTLDRIRAYYKARGTWEEFERVNATGSSMHELATQWETPQLAEYEELVLRSLAMSRMNVRTALWIADALQIESETVDITLASLSSKHLVWSFETHLFGRFFMLTKSGRDYATAHGLFPFPHRRI
jgi:hypothetical protein